MERIQYTDVVVALTGVARLAVRAMEYGPDQTALLAEQAQQACDLWNAYLVQQSEDCFRITLP